METKGLTCKIPLDLHNQISEEIRETESCMSKFIEMVIREHYQKGEVNMTEKGKTLAFQVSGELFQRIKEYLVLYEQALEEAEEEFEAARAAAHESQQEQAESGPEAAEGRDPDADAYDGDNAQNSEVPPTEDDAEGDLA